MARRGLVDVQVAREIAQQTHGGELGGADGETADGERKMDQSRRDIAALYRRLRWFEKGRTPAAKAGLTV